MKYYGETDNVNYHQTLTAKQPLSEVLRSLHGGLGRPKTKIVYRRKHDHPNMAQLIRKLLTWSERRSSESKIGNTFARSSLQNPSENGTEPDRAMLVELIPEVPLSDSYDKFVTALHIFSRYIFSYPASIQDAETTDRVIISTRKKYTHLPTTIISDNESAFVSQLIKLVADILGITPEYATTEPAQTIGEVETTHASMRKAL